jgi:hypothetical protein
MVFWLIHGGFGAFYPNSGGILITHFLPLENVLEKGGKNGRKRA